jgi:hypothetical protein
MRSGVGDGTASWRLAMSGGGGWAAKGSCKGERLSDLRQSLLALRAALGDRVCLQVGGCHKSWLESLPVTGIAARGCREGQVASGGRVAIGLLA